MTAASGGAGTHKAHVVQRSNRQWAVVEQGRHIFFTGVASSEVFTLLLTKSSPPSCDPNKTHWFTKMKNPESLVFGEILIETTMWYNPSKDASYPTRKDRWCGEEACPHVPVVNVRQLRASGKRVSLLNFFH